MMKLYFDDGGYVEFPAADQASAEAVVQWFRTAEPEAILTLNTETGVATHAAKQHISRIEVR